MEHAFGTACIACSWVLLFVRDYQPVPRLIGYRLIVLVAGFRPLKRANAVWLLYGFL